MSKSTRLIQLFCKNNLRTEISTLREIGWSVATDELLQKELKNQFNTILHGLIEDLIKKIEPGNHSLKLMITVDLVESKFYIKAQFTLESEEAFKLIEEQVQDFYNDAPTYFAHTQGVIVKPEYAAEQKDPNTVLHAEVIESLNEIAESVLENTKSHMFVSGLAIPDPNGGVKTLRLHPTLELKQKIQERKQKEVPSSDKIKINGIKISSKGYSISGHSQALNKSISMIIPDHLISTREQECGISPSRFNNVEIEVETQEEHGTIIVKKIIH